MCGLWLISRPSTNLLNLCLTWKSFRTLYKTRSLAQAQQDVCRYVLCFICHSMAIHHFFLHVHVVTMSAWHIVVKSRCKQFPCPKKKKVCVTSTLRFPQTHSTQITIHANVTPHLNSAKAWSCVLGQNTFACIVDIKSSLCSLTSTLNTPQCDQG